MQWNEGFEWAPFGVLWIKKACTVYEWLQWTFEAPQMQDVLIQRLVETKSERFAERIWGKSSFHLFYGCYTFFHRFQTVISIAMSKHYILQMNHRFVLRGVYCLYFLLVFLFLIVSFFLSSKLGLKLKKSTVEELVCFFYWKF